MAASAGHESGQNRIQKDGKKSESLAFGMGDF
jgi:hypothetical protein